MSVGMVGRLRRAAAAILGDGQVAMLQRRLLEDAADEIERLQREIERIKQAREGVNQ